jgi:hypothetical protein
MADYFGDSNDSELLAKAQLFWSGIKTAPTDFNLTADKAAELKTKVDGFSTSLTAHTAAQADSFGKREQKDTDRDILETALRELRQFIKASKIDAAKIATLGVPTELQSAVPSNATRPVGRVDTSQRLRHEISFADEATPDLKRKPRGLLGCEIWLKLDGTPPVDESECRFLTLDAFTPYLMEYEGTDAGKMAHYLLRWRYREGGVSSFAATISATITG